MKKKTLKYSVSIAVLATMLQATPTFASPITQGQLDTAKGQLSQTQGKIDDLETKVQQLDDQIILSMDKSQKISVAIQKQQGQIDETKVKIEKARKDLEEHKLIYSARLRGMQSEGQSKIITYTELLLSSKNISEFLTRSTAIAQILQSDTDIMNTLNEKEQILNQAEQQLHDEMKSLQNSQKELATEQEKIKTAKQQEEKELADSKNDLQQQQGQLEQLKKQWQTQILAAQRARELARKQAEEQARQRTSQNDHSNLNLSNDVPSPNSASAEAVISYAEQFLGTPYVWGGSSPGGFDCSGLMQYVFSHAAGIQLPRVARDQQDVGIRISPSQVQPGDLVFQGDPAYHVGMYIGGGEWIQAPETGDVVKISSYNPSRFSSASRILR